MYLYPTPSPSPVSSVPAAIFPYSTGWQAFWEIFRSFLVYIIIAVIIVWIAYTYSKYGGDRKIMGGGCDACIGTVKF
jgi:ABC-type glucose/galactose transport system permease subunit